MLNVAMLSKWHVHAPEYARRIAQSGRAAVTCVWDEEPARGAQWAEELGAAFEPDLDALLARGDVDAVVLCSPTSMHADLMCRAAAAGKHIFTEKCMCLTLEDCDRAAEAVRKNGVVFTISFPHRCMGRNLKIRELIESGVIGEVTLIRDRDAHDGALADWLPGYWYDPATTGGGAMMDLGAHPMYLCRWLADSRPVRVVSVFNTRTGRAVEDNAASLIEFENGVIGVAETSLVAPMCPAELTVYGTKGVIHAEDKRLRLRTKTLQGTEEGGWIPVKIPEDLPHPIDQWLDSILCGKPVRFGLEEGRDLTELMVLAYRGAE